MLFASVLPFFFRVPQDPMVTTELLVLLDLL